MSLRNLKEHTAQFLHEVEDELYGVEQLDSGHGDENVADTLLENNRVMTNKIQEVVDAIIKISERLNLLKQKPKVEQTQEIQDPEFVEAEKALNAAQIQQRQLYSQLLRVKENFNGLGDQIDKKIRLENELKDVERQKQILYDVVNSNQKYIDESSNILQNSNQAVTQQGKFEVIQNEIKEYKRAFRDLNAQLRENKTEKVNEEFQQVVNALSIQQQLKQTIDTINRGGRVRQSQQIDRPKKLLQENSNMSPNRGPVNIRNLKANQEPLSITEEMQLKKRNLSLINKVSNDKTTDYQMKLKQIQIQISEKEKLIEQMNHDNQQIANEIKGISEKIDPKSMEYMVAPVNSRLYPNQEGMKQQVIFKRDYSRPRQRLDFSGMNRLSEINKSVDYHNLESLNKDGVNSRFPSIAQTDAKKGKFSGVNQSMEYKIISQKNGSSAIKSSFLNRVRQDEEFDADTEEKLINLKSTKMQSNFTSKRQSQAKNAIQADNQYKSPPSHNFHMRNASIENGLQEQDDQVLIDENIEIDPLSIGVQHFNKNIPNQYDGDQQSPVQNKVYKVGDVRKSIQNGQFQR
eukprot:403359367